MCQAGLRGRLGDKLARACTPAFRVDARGRQDSGEFGLVLLDASEFIIEDDALRLLIRAKLADGRLPHESIERFWGGHGNGEVCAACEAIISKKELVMEGVEVKGGSVSFHIRCFQFWNEERNPR